MSVENNKAIVRRSWELYEAKEHEGSRALFADDCVAHVAGYPTPLGIDEYARQGAVWLTAFPDLSIRVEDQMAEGDKVVSRMTLRGAHQGELLGAPPSGKRVEISGILIDRIEDGKIVERWASWDLLGLLQQTGAIPSPG